MGASRKPRKVNIANDLPKQAKRVTLVTISANPESAGRLAAGTVLLLALGLTAFSLAALRDDRPIATPAPIATSAAAAAPASHGENLKIPAALLAPNAPDAALVGDIAASLSSTPALNTKKRITVSMAAPQDIDDLLTEGAAAAEESHWDDALLAYSRALAAEPHNHDALSGKVYALAQKGDTIAAVAASMRLVEIYPEDVAARANAARLLARQKRDGEAMDEWEKIIKASPGTAAYRLEYAVLADHAGRRDKAVEQYRAALDNNRDDSIAAEPVRRRLDYLADSMPPSTTEPEASR